MEADIEKLREIAQNPKTGRSGDISYYAKMLDSMQEFCLYPVAMRSIGSHIFPPWRNQSYRLTTSFISEKSYQTY